MLENCRNRPIARRESGRSALVERPEEWLNNNGISG
jgi:hypothetical protein